MKKNKLYQNIRFPHCTSSKIICETRQICILALKSDSKDWLHTREISLCLKRVPCGKPLISTWILIHQADNRYMNLMTEWKARRENIGLRYQISTLHIIKIKDYQDKKQLFYFNIYLVKTSCLLHMLDNKCKNINQFLVICKTDKFTYWL